MGVDGREGARPHPPERGISSQAGIPADVGELRVVASTGSTNDDVMALGRRGAPHGSSEASHEQTQGRGRRGHVWGSPAGGLYLSVLLRPEVSMSHYVGLSAVCALGALDALWSLGATAALLKWPNDIVVPASGAAGGQTRKLCGLLLEAGTGEAGRFVVAGIGVNLEPPQLSSDLGSVNPLAPAALPDAMGPGGDGSPRVAPGFDELAQALRLGIVARCDAWAAEVNAGHFASGPLTPVLDEYLCRLPLLGHDVSIVLPDGAVTDTGVFSTVDVWGRAHVRLADGRDLTVSSEQASLRPLCN